MELDVTFSRSIRVWWALLWKSVLIYFVFGILLILVMKFTTERGNSPDKDAAILYFMGFLFSFPSSFLAVVSVLGEKYGKFCLVLIKPITKIASGDQDFELYKDQPNIRPENTLQEHGLNPGVNTPNSSSYETILDITFDQVLRVWWALLWRSVILCVGSSFALGFGMSVSRGFMGPRLADSVHPFIIYPIAVVIALIAPLIAIWMILGKDFRSFRLALISSQDEQGDLRTGMPTNSHTTPEPAVDACISTTTEPTLVNDLPIRGYNRGRIRLIQLVVILFIAGVNSIFKKDLAPFCLVGLWIVILMMFDSIRFIKQLGSHILPSVFFSLFIILSVIISVLMFIPEEESSPTMMDVVLIGSSIGFVVMLICSSMGFYCCSELNIERSYFPKLIYSETEGYSNIFHAVLIVLLFSGCAVLYTYVLFKMTSPKISNELINILKIKELPLNIGLKETQTSIPLVVSIAFLEEIIFRLGIQNYLAYTFRLLGNKYWYAVIITSLLWSLGHSHVLDPTWVKYVQIFPMGIALGFMFKKYGIESCMLAHGSFNALGAVLVKYIQPSI